MFRAGDEVLHKPTGEEWVLAFGDHEDPSGKVSACGWPESLAEPSDCKLLKKANDLEHAAMLHTWATNKGKAFDVRVSVAKNYLARVESGHGPSEDGQ